MTSSQTTEAHVRFIMKSSIPDAVSLENIKGQLQREYKLLSYERAVKMLKIDICVTVIGQAVLEIFHFKVDILRKSLKIIIFLDVSIKSGEQ